MRRAIPASLAVHVGLFAAAWLGMQWKPEAPSMSEAAVSIDIVAMEDAVTEPSETVSDSSASLVSAGTTSVAAEPVETEMVEVDPVEPAEVAEAAPAPAQPVSAVPLAETVAPAETEAIVSAEVMTARAALETLVAAPIPRVTDDAAPAVTETIAPSDADILERLDHAARLIERQPTPEVQEITTASITPLTPARPLESPIPVKVANLRPIVEPAIEQIVEAPPIPKPRLDRKPIEAEEEPADKQPVEKKKAERLTEKPVEKKQLKQVASLGSGGEDEADAAAAKASGGKQKASATGSGNADAYPGRVFARLSKAVRRPRGSFDGGEVRIMFTLDAAGHVIKTALAKSSGDSKVDDAAFAAVGRASFPPIPEGTGKSTWSFTFPLVIK